MLGEVGLVEAKAEAIAADAAVAIAVTSAIDVGGDWGWHVYTRYRISYGDDVDKISKSSLSPSWKIIPGANLCNLVVELGCQQRASPHLSPKLTGIASCHRPTRYHSPQLTTTIKPLASTDTRLLRFRPHSGFTRN